MLCFIDELQEDDTILYLMKADLGQLKPDYGITDWVRVGAVFTDALQPAKSGTRKIEVQICLFDTRWPPNYIMGTPSISRGAVWVGKTSFTHEFTEPGYEEEREHRIEAREIAIKIGICVALADGELADTEGEVLNSWTNKILATESESQKGELKQRYNNAMRDAYASVERGDLSLEPLTHRMREVGNHATKNEAVELCYEIMAADGVAAASELEVLRHVATELELDYDRIQKLHDQAMVTLDASSNAHASIEETLGIDPSWDQERIKSHLLENFSKWNSRMAGLTDPLERANAQRMIDRIAEARKKYG